MWASLTWSESFRPAMDFSRTKAISEGNKYKVHPKGIFEGNMGGESREDEEDVLGKNIRGKQNWKQNGVWNAYLHAAHSNALLSLQCTLILASAIWGSPCCAVSNRLSIQSEALPKAKRMTLFATCHSSSYRFPAMGQACLVRSVQGVLSGAAPEWGARCQHAAILTELPGDLRAGLLPKGSVLLGWCSSA